MFHEHNRRNVCAISALLLSTALVTSCGKSSDQNATGDQKTAAPPDTRPNKTRKDAESAAKPAVKPTQQRYVDVESAAITFAYTGWQEGTVTAYISDYGDTVALTYDMKKPVAEKKTIIWRDGKNAMWSVGTEPKTVHVSSLRARDTELRLVRTRDARQLQIAGYVKRPNETVAGKECEVWHNERQNVTIWRWQGIDLKYVNGSVSEKSTYTVEAVSVQSPAPLPAEVLEYPEGYQINDRTQKRKPE